MAGKKCERPSEIRCLNPSLGSLVDIPSGQLRHASQMSPDVSGPYAHTRTRRRGRRQLVQARETVLRAARYLAYAPHAEMLSRAYAPIISLPAPRTARLSLLTAYLPAGHAERYNLPKDPSVRAGRKKRRRKRDAP